MNGTPRLFRAALITATGAALALAPALTSAASAATPHTTAHQRAATHSSMLIERMSIDDYFSWSGDVRPTGSFAFFVDGQRVGVVPMPSPSAKGSTAHGVVAQLAKVIPGGRPHTVEVRYVGDANYAPSSDSRVRRDPTITSWTRSSVKETRYGWWRAPVTVGFSCVAHGGNVVCPSPATISSEGAGWFVTGKMTAGDGGQASLTVHVHLDMTRPNVSLKRVNGVPRCVGSDALSGLASCTLTKSTAHGVTIYRAVAVDKAGNTRAVSGRL